MIQVFFSSIVESSQPNCTLLGQDAFPFKQ